jgi:hypothetical protein
MQGSMRKCAFAHRFSSTTVLLTAYAIGSSVQEPFAPCRAPTMDAGTGDAIPLRAFGRYLPPQGCAG